MLNSGLMNLFIDPAEGGRISELDWKPRSFNLMNTLTRRREGYHDKISTGGQGHGAQAGHKTIHERVAVKEEGLQYHLLYDWYKRGSLLDHFLGSGVDLAGFMRSEYYEAGDFVLGAYDLKQKKQGEAQRSPSSATGMWRGSASASGKRSPFAGAPRNFWCAMRSRT